jgi:ribosomal protein S27AE
MAKKFTFTLENKRIAEHIIMCDVSHLIIARKIGCEVTTLKQWLVRHRLIETETAKYLQATEVETRTRPCMQCGVDEEQPRNRYMCGRCRAQITRII